jgi:hypothetical protein
MGTEVIQELGGAGSNANKNISISCMWGDYDNDGYLTLFCINGSTSSTVKQESFFIPQQGNKNIY